jgi:hypothetical protein
MLVATVAQQKSIAVAPPAVPSVVTEPFRVALVVVMAVATPVVLVTAAEAGDTATNARPATIRAVVAPSAAIDLAIDRRDRRPTWGFTKFFIGFPPLHDPSGSNT